MESLLKTYGTTFSAAADDSDITKSDATDFFDNLPNYLVGLSKGIEMGDDAIVAKYADVAAIRVQKLEFEGIADTDIEVSCSDCSSVIDATGVVSNTRIIRNIHACHICHRSTVHMCGPVYGVNIMLIVVRHLSCI